MKRKTILKAIGFLFGWLVSFQLMSVGLNIMSKPSNIYFTLGALLELVVLFGIFYFAGRLGQAIANLVMEYKDNKHKQLNTNN